MHRILGRIGFFGSMRSSADERMESKNVVRHPTGNHKPQFDEIDKFKK